MAKPTAQEIMNAGAVSWLIKPMGDIVHKLHVQGYTFDEIFDGTRICCYVSWGELGPGIRMVPTYDPRSVYCPTCDDPGIVMQPTADGWECPRCHTTKQNGGSDT